MTVSVSMIVNDRAQISQAHGQDGLCLFVYYCECRELRVLKHFVDVYNYFVFVFVRFLLYVVYVFALCSPYLEDNKVPIYLSIRWAISLASLSYQSIICSQMSVSEIRFKADATTCVLISTFKL